MGLWLYLVSSLGDDEILNGSRELPKRDGGMG